LRLINVTSAEIIKIFTTAEIAETKKDSVSFDYWTRICSYFWI